MQNYDESVSQVTEKLKIFYDGGCKVCAWEVDKYVKHDKMGVLGKIDINASGFDATRFGLDAARVRKYFHVLTNDGKVIAGVDAFIEIWKALDTPLSSRAAKVARLWPIHAALEIGYSGFILIRPYLPRNKGIICDDGSCDYSSRPSDSKKR